MATSPTSGIQTLTEHPVQVVGILTALLAKALATDYASGLTQDFLLKKVRYHLALEDLDPREYMIIGLARGDATVAQIAAIMESANRDPDDLDLWDDFAIANAIFWETVRILGGTDVVTSSGQVLNEDISIGGGKGLPLEGGVGIQVFAWNPHSAVSVGNVGTTIVGIVNYVGVFMAGT